MLTPIKTTFRTDDGVRTFSLPEDLHPTGWRVLIRPKQQRLMSDGGILLADETVETKELLDPVGRVIAMGTLCYREERFHGETWCAVGDWVLFSRYGGQVIDIPMSSDDDGSVRTERWRIVNDDEIQAVLTHPDLIRVYQV